MKETSTDSANPLAKVPALELPNGMSLFDSPVIGLDWIIGLDCNQNLTAASTYR
jgi:hypothetical protein